MKLQRLLYCLLFFLIYTACDDTGNASVSESSGVSTTETSTNANNTPAANDNSNTTSTAAPASRPVREKHDCELIGKALEDGSFWIAEKEVLLVVVADTAEMYDNDYPESYRSFQVYNTITCDLIGNHVMPVNKSPDYPYYLYPETYDEVNQVVCAQGTDFVYCYDLQRNEMLMPMIPEYRSKRRATDASSGLPQGLTIWDRYLFGYATDFGTYGFDLTDKRQVKPLVPLAEYLDRETGIMNQLFVIDRGSGQYQAVYSNFDYDAGEDAISLTPLFEKPLPISIRIPASARNNNLLVFKYRDGSSAIGVDMDKGERVDLPADVAGKSVGDIIAWMKKR